MDVDRAPEEARGGGEAEAAHLLLPIPHFKTSRWGHSTLNYMLGTRMRWDQGRTHIRWASPTLSLKQCLGDFTILQLIMHRAGTRSCLMMTWRSMTAPVRRQWRRQAGYSTHEDQQHQAERGRQ